MHTDLDFRFVRVFMFKLCDSQAMFTLVLLNLINLKHSRHQTLDSTVLHRVEETKERI